MLARLQSTLVVIVLWLSVRMSRAFLFTHGTPTQCDALTISWTGGSPPYQLLIVPVFAVPRNVSIPADSFKDGQGSFSIQTSYPAGQKLLLTMSDATGFGSGGSTNVLVVGSSQGGTCDFASATPDFQFELNSALQQCSVLSHTSAVTTADNYIRSVCFSPDGVYLATGAEDKQIQDIATKSIRNVFCHDREVYALDFSLDGRLIVSGLGDHTVRIWSMDLGISKVSIINDPDSLGNDVGVTSVAISPNGGLVAAGSLDTIVRIWDLETAQLVAWLRGHRDSVYSIAFTPDGQGLVSRSLDKTLKYWDISWLSAGVVGSGVKSRLEGQAGGLGLGSLGGEEREEGLCMMDFVGHKDYVLSVAVSRDGQWIISGSKDNGVRCWDARTGEVKFMLQGHKNSVMSVDLSPAGNILATGSGDWRVRIWSFNTT